MTATPELVIRAGQTQLVLGGPQLLLLAALGILALQIKVTDGKTSCEKSTRVECGADGSQVVTIYEKVTYGISEELAILLGKLVPRGS